MKKLFKKATFLFLVISALLITSCSNDDDGPFDGTVQLASKTYVLGSVSDPGISGEAKFILNSDTTITIELQLTGTLSGGMHPAHIHVNTAAEGGVIALNLGIVNGDTGFSTITIATLEDGTAISYEELLNFDGYINVHLSSTELTTLVAQGDIGQNELSGTSKVYALGELGTSGVSGTATFSERVNGETLAVLDLDGTTNGVIHPAHIHFNTALEGGGVAYTFKNATDIDVFGVDGTTGLGVYNIANLDDETNAFTYDMLIGFDGYINIHNSPTDLTTLLAQGDIGQNAFTGESITYVLNEVDIPGSNGTVTFSERENGNALAVINVVNTTPGITYPAHIHMGSVANAPGDILFSFASVDGDTGMSMTNVSVLNDTTTSFGYSEVLTVDGYVNVHTSTGLIAQGNIGTNN